MHLGFFFLTHVFFLYCLYPPEGGSDGQIISGICSSSVQRGARTAGGWAFLLGLRGSSFVWEAKIASTGLGLSKWGPRDTWESNMQLLRQCVYVCVIVLHTEYQSEDILAGLYNF